MLTNKRVRFSAESIDAFEIVEKLPAKVVAPSMGDHGRSWAHWAVKCPVCSARIRAHKASFGRKVHATCEKNHDDLIDFEPELVEHYKPMDDITAIFEFEHIWWAESIEEMNATNRMAD